MNEEQPPRPNDGAVAAGRPRRHSIHSTSPTSTDQLPLPDAAPMEPAADPAATPKDAQPTADGALHSLESMYEAISTVPLDYRRYPSPLYYPIGGPDNPAGAPSAFAGQWGVHSFGQEMQSYAPMGLVGRGERRSGRCKFFNALKGFGFILDHRGDELGPDVEVFVHYSAIQAVQGSRGGFKSLSENEEVEYTITQGAKGWQAQDVTGPNGAPVIGSPSTGTGPKSPSQSAYDRKFSVGSIGSDDFRLNGFAAQRPRGSTSGTDSGYYSSAMTSPVHTPHQLYSPPQNPAYPHPSPHMLYGSPPMGMPLPLHPGNGYSFMPPPPPPHHLLPDGTPPPSAPLPLGHPAQNGQQVGRAGPSPHHPLPPNAFFQPGPPPPPFRNGPMPAAYYGSPPEGYYIPQHHQMYGFSPPYPPPLPMPTGLGAIAGYAESSSGHASGEASPSEVSSKEISLKEVSPKQQAATEGIAEGVKL